MYQTVSPTLYHSPIVQNVGQFLEGIQHPYQSQTTPYHKLDLLDKVFNLSIIHASSSEPVKSPRLSILDNGIAPDPNAVDMFMVDRLGKSDLESWKLANVLSKSITAGSDTRPLPAILFKNLKALSFGIWDDGRWLVYKDREEVYRRFDLKDIRVFENGWLVRKRRDQSWGQYKAGRDDQGRQLKDVFPVNHLRLVLARILSVGPIPQAICHHIGAGVNDPYDEVFQLRIKPPTLRIVHAKNGVQLKLPFLDGPTRVYIPIDTSNGSFFESNVAWSMKNLRYEFRHCLQSTAPQVRDSSKRATKRAERLERSILELCLVPVKSGDKEQLQKAQLIKAALEGDHGNKAKTFIEKVRFLIGDEVPACPCCGMT
jgi:hypothetical protein